MRLASFALLLVVGCTTLPKAPPARTPDALVAAVRREARDEEWSELYRHLSRRRRDGTSRLTFVLGFPSQRLPAPHAYRVADLVAKGSCDAIYESPDGARAIVYCSYSEPGRPRFDAEILILREDGERRVDGLVR